MQTTIDEIDEIDITQRTARPVSAARPIRAGRSAPRISIPRELEEAWRIGYNDPVWWIENVLRVKLYSKAKDIVNAARDYDRIAVRSGHGVGKSYTLACIALWWALVRKGTVLVTGPKFEQTKAIFFSRFTKILAGAVIPPALTPSMLPDSDKWELGPEQGIWIINSAKQTAINIQGYHAENMLLIADEAAGIDDALFEASDATQVSRGVSHATAKKILAGNPTEENNCTIFKKANMVGQQLQAGNLLPGGCLPDPKRWVVIHISSYDSPNVTGEMTVPGLVGIDWIKEKEEEYGPESMLFSVRVLGEYFEGGAVDRLIPESALETWLARKEPSPFREHLHWGVLPGHDSIAQGFDGARYGDDACVSTIISHGRIIDIEARNKLSTGDAAAFMLERHLQFGCKRTSLDGTGQGAGIYDDAIVLTSDSSSRYADLCISMVNFASKSSLIRYRNIRTQMAFDLQEAIRFGYIVPDEYLGTALNRLIEDIRATGYEAKDNGVILEPKEVIKGKLGRSPDYFDSLMLAFHAYIRSVELPPERIAAMELEAAIQKAFGSYSAVAI